MRRTPKTKPEMSPAVAAILDRLYREFVEYARLEIRAEQAAKRRRKR